MLYLLPIASAIHPGDTTSEIVTRVAGQLEPARVPHQVWPALAELPGLESQDVVAILLVTGGTEHAALAAAAQLPDPVILLTHPACNSFPAALEVLARLRQEGRRGRIAMLDERPESSEKLEQVLHSLATHRRLRAARLGMLGGPSSWLVASSPRPEQLATTYCPQVIEIAMAEVLEAIAAADRGEVEQARERLTEDVHRVVEPNEDDLIAAARVYVGVRELVERHRLSALTLRCFDLVTELRTTGCLALSRLIDDGIMAGCEGDLPATITMMWMHYLTAQLPFMANPQDVDVDTNTMAIAHCTVARGLVERCTLRSHFESSLGVGIQGQLRPGPITLARIGGAELTELFVSNGELLVSEDRPARCRTQVRLRLEAPLEQLLTRPLGNHHVMIEGHWQDRLEEYHRCYQQAPTRA